MMFVVCFVLGFLSGAVIAWVRLQHKIRVYEAIQDGIFAQYAAKMMHEAGVKAVARQKETERPS